MFSLFYLYTTWRCLNKFFYKSINIENQELYTRRVSPMCNKNQVTYQQRARQNSKRR